MNRHISKYNKMQVSRKKSIYSQKKAVFSFQKRISLNKKIKIIGNQSLEKSHKDFRYQGGIYDPRKDLKAKILEIIMKGRYCKESKEKQRNLKTISSQNNSFRMNKICEQRKSHKNHLLQSLVQQKPCKRFSIKKRLPIDARKRNYPDKIQRNKTFCSDRKIQIFPHFSENLKIQKQMIDLNPWKSEIGNEQIDFI